LVRTSIPSTQLAKSNNSPQNDGSSGDASRRAEDEAALYPYSWFDNTAYQSRGTVSGTIKLSDGRPASGAAIFLGDNHPNETALDMGRYYYYTTYADSTGSFTIPHVRTATYSLQAWPNGGSIRDVTTTLLINDISVQPTQPTSLGPLLWKTQSRGPQIFQVGDFDRKSLGFAYGGAPRQHALVAKCPANLTHIAGHGNTQEWCFAQSALGTWTIKFHIHSLPPDTSAILSVSLAGYSSGVSSTILLNNSTVIGNLTSGYIPSDPCLYRSGTEAGEWHLFEFPIANGTVGGLVEGWNMVDFRVTRTSLWHGFMWDSIILEYAS
jgi:rhamnogalacturonan endolyase